jgi:hypothetical protein
MIFLSSPIAGNSANFFNAEMILEVFSLIVDDTRLSPKSSNHGKKMVPYCTLIFCEIFLKEIGYIE